MDGSLSFCYCGNDGYPLSFLTNIHIVVQDQHEHVILSIQLHTREDNLSTVIFNGFFTFENANHTQDLAHTLDHSLVHNLGWFAYHLFTVYNEITINAIVLVLVVDLDSLDQVTFLFEP